jgi:hypothetical protein
VPKALTPVPVVEHAPPVAPKPTYTILDAIKDLHTGVKVGTLMIVHAATGKSFEVLGYDQKTGATTMRNGDGLKIKPVLSERECSVYIPLWR